MEESVNGKSPPDRYVYVANRGRWTIDDLLPYQDQWVAWSADGLCVAAHDPDLVLVSRNVLDRGLKPEEVVLEYIPAGGEVTLL